MCNVISCSPDVNCAGDILSEYVEETGKYIDASIAQDYTLQLNTTRITGINNAVVGKGLGSFVNCCKGLKNCRPNTAFHYDHKTSKVFIKAITDIQQGEELYVSYGSAYWSAWRKRYSVGENY